MKTIVCFSSAFTLGALLTAILLRGAAPAPPVAKAAYRPAAPRPAASMSMRATAAPAARDDNSPLLPPPVLTPAPESAAAAPPAPLWPQAGLFVRPAEESMMSTWAARDPEGAGRWLNQNRTHPQFADMVRGYAIQIATIDPDAARQWAAQIPTGQNRFLRGSTLEQHIDAIEQMLRGPAVGSSMENSPETSKPVMGLADYQPVLVRQNAGEAPVLEMMPLSPFG